ncbi:glycosyltransferase family 2 protein [Paenibacillus lupini]|uniref:glycosyltransferase family 2 protein n=1 Tax=Paenibacillus lupini TaxID=1450204 RepID=UPI0014201E0D|nr:glycosyltransferase family 2 protein [Paenibacillus lupini]NIK23007.1 glycosyltransferase involved in cell wall biosynthesis [Paenibacillus lupini]
MNQLVSVIVPTYRGADKLSRAIESIIKQTYSPIEIIVVDDNDPQSKDRQKTQKIMKEFDFKNIKYIKHECNKNGSAARNTGISHSSGEYICFLDDDDFYLPDRVKKSVEVLEQNHLYDAVYCNVILTNSFQEISGVIHADKELVQKDILLNENSIGTGSNLFVVKSALERLNGFDESFRRHQDLEFLLRYLEIFKIKNIDEPLIVKAKNGTDNIPEYKGFLATKQHYWSKFNYVLDALDKNEKNMFYGYHYGVLLDVAIKSKNKEYINEAKYNLEKFRGLTKKEKLIMYLEFHPFIKLVSFNSLKKVNRLFSLFRKKRYFIEHEVREKVNETFGLEVEV